MIDDSSPNGKGNGQLDGQLTSCDPNAKPTSAEDEAALERGTLIDFPSEFPIKIMGPATDAFIKDIKQAVDGVVPGLPESAWKERASGKGNFVGLTVTFTATSRQQIDDVYRAITAHPDVKMCL
ncbi:YbeD family protein [Guyparkeria sp. TX1]|uniref:YbeD family protein n=1 Tax=Guyparkeria sp. TX1 TaxID=3115001 RepID=UPI00397752FA